MGWWSRKKNGDSPGTYSQVSGRNGKTEGFGKTEDIPGMVLEGLGSPNEGLAIMRISNLAAENNYNKTDVCEHLIRLIQRDGREKVVDAASDALVKVLGNVFHADTVILLIKQGLFAKNEKNAALFVKMLEEPGCHIKLKACAIEMLSGFSENDLSVEAMDNVEAALFERHEDPKENAEIRNLIIYRFGPNRNGRPKVGVTHERPDETLLLDETTEEGKPREAKAAHAPEDKETEALDVLSGWIEMLNHPDVRRREMAAKSLINISGQTKDRKKVGRIVDAFREAGADFLSHYRKARSTLHGLGPDPNMSDRKTVPPEPNGLKRDSKEPTAPQKIMKR